MLQPGLVSVTFADASYTDVIRRAHGAGLRAIEWHGLKHVPHGDLDTARRVGQHTRDAGLQPAAYGSYYVIGKSEDTGLPFATVLETAVALGAPKIRVWAGDRNPDQTSAAARDLILQETRRIADLAAEQQTPLILEFHENSLTQTGRACAALLEDVNHPNLGTYWQPAPGLDVHDNLAALHQVLPWLAGLHVFHWRPTHLDRHPLAQGEADWIQYLNTARLRGRPLNVLLEFAKDDSPEQFEEDAATLHRLLKEGPSP